MMNVLVGCEEHQIVAQAFLKRGHNALSCDIKPTRGNPDYHHQGDVVEYLHNKEKGEFDLIILHPECTAMSLSGNRHYAKGKPHYNERLKAIDWTLKLWELAKSKSKRVVLENPGSVIFKYLDNVQYIQPYQFGHGEKKQTGLALHNVEKLIPTNIVEGREERIWRMPPGPERQRLRSMTYPGIAEAFAEQWG